jgi:hypothetical protein
LVIVAEIFWQSIWLPVVIGIGFSFLVERLVQPGTVAFWKRPAPAFAIHAGLFLLVFVFELTLFRRPWFAATVTSSFLFFIVLVNNAKYHSLREPFIFQDFEYFTDTLKHPRLYLPFLGWGNGMLAIAAFSLTVYAGMKLEPSLTKRVSQADFFLGVALLVLLTLALLWLGTRKKMEVTFAPEKDVQQLGLLTSLWRYGEEEFALCRIPSGYDRVCPVSKRPDSLANLVVVQSESFFDPRDIYDGIRPDLLKSFDSIKDAAAYHGKLAVPAWGANTVRTEFAFLSGLDADKQGVHRFNPYRKLARQGGWTLASFLKNLGYRTVCVHPYHASFYARDKVFAKLGFDEFVDISNFSEADRSGPYVGDVALAEKVGFLLEKYSGQPLFILVITMENHGPLHWEKVVEGEMAHFYSIPPPDGCDDLTIYLRHLTNADQMAGILRHRLESLPGANWLCWFGDHVPIMPKVYRAMGTPKGPTDYVIWQKGGSFGPKNRVDMRVEDLGLLLLEQMGLISPLPEEDPERRPVQFSCSAGRRSVPAEPRR